MRVVSENVANANSTANEAGGDPYRRKTISFKELIDGSTGSSLVETTEIERDQSDFTVRYEPQHPASYNKCYVTFLNVKPLIEMANMREASRSYEANLPILEQARSMRSQLIYLLE